MVKKGRNTTITKTASSTLLNCSPIDSLLPPAGTRVVIEGFDGDKQTAVIVGYSGDGLCHVIDKESNETFIIPENTCLPLPEVFGDPLPFFEIGTDVYAVWPETDTLYMGHVLDNTVDKNNKISIQFEGDNDEPMIESILVVDIVCLKDVPATALKCEFCSKLITRVKKKINAFAPVKCLKCKKYFYIHRKCKTRNTKLHKEFTNDKGNCFICDKCVAPCFLCGTKDMTNTTRA